MQYTLNEQDVFERVWRVYLAGTDRDENGQFDKIVLIIYCLFFFRITPKKPRYTRANRKGPRDERRVVCDVVASTGGEGARARTDTVINRRRSRCSFVISREATIVCRRDVALR